jgi:hypothetical protein
MAQIAQVSPKPVCRRIFRHQFSHTDFMPSPSDDEKDDCGCLLDLHLLEVRWK